MRWIRAAVVAGVLAGGALGCSKQDQASRPANAPAVSDEKPLGTPSPMGAGAKQRTARPGN